MLLGRYVYTSNRVIAELVYGRDWFDDMLDSLHRFMEGYFVVVAPFYAAQRVVRVILKALYRVIHFANLSLSRQMEFNADLVAVRVTGSDAIAHALARTEFAEEIMAQAWEDLTAAGHHKLYTRDLFYHQSRAADYLRTLRKNPRLGEPPDLPADPRQTVQVFPPSDVGTPKMWATHPSNHDREANAKRVYIRSPHDDRSAWFLFQDAPALREKMTRRVYKVLRHVRREDLQPRDVVQAFIDEEHSEMIYDPRYHGLYDDRFIMPGGTNDLARADPAEFAGTGTLDAARGRLFGHELKARMDAHRARLQERDMLLGLARGRTALVGKTFLFRGAPYRPGDVGRLLEQVRQEFSEDFAWMAGLDRLAFRVHAEMARRLDAEVLRELEERYRFHLTLQDMHVGLSAHNNRVRAALAGVAGKQEIPENEFRAAVAAIKQAHEALAKHLRSAAHVPLPGLKNVAPGGWLGPFLLGRSLVAPLIGRQTSVEGAWVGEFLGQLAEVVGKTQRIRFKSLGKILALQEEIAGRWSAVQTAGGQPHSG
jgi:hypothetical protein